MHLVMYHSCCMQEPQLINPGSSSAWPTVYGVSMDVAAVTQASTGCWLIVLTPSNLNLHFQRPATYTIISVLQSSHNTPRPITPWYRYYPKNQKTILL